MPGPGAASSSSFISSDKQFTPDLATTSPGSGVELSTNLRDVLQCPEKAATNQNVLYTTVFRRYLQTYLFIYAKTLSRHEFGTLVHKDHTDRLLI